MLVKCGAVDAFVRIRMRFQPTVIDFRSALDTQTIVAFIHTSQRGGYLGDLCLGLIAQRYRCRVSDLKRWNGLRRTTIYPGQRLIVYTSSGTSTAATVSKPHKISGTENVHVVKSGETLGVISKWYGCSVNELKKWNNLNKSTIHPNQKLYVKNPELAQSGSSKSAVTTTEKGYVYHTVKKGETLWDIANLYYGVTVKKIKSLNNITNVKRIQPGQKIKISKTG